jgi:hypothetical protein
VVASPRALPNAEAVARADALRKYISEMGVDPQLLELAAKIPHESMHNLSRDEMASLRIDAREFHESRWAILDETATKLSIAKFVTQARGADRKEFRTSMIYLSCAGARRVIMIHSRGLASDDIGQATKLLFSVGSRKMDFSQRGPARKIDALDTGALFDTSFDYVPFESFDEAAASGSIDITEGGHGKAPRVIKLSTDGLPEAMASLRRRCAGVVSR